MHTSSRTRASRWNRIFTVTLRARGVEENESENYRRRIHDYAQPYDPRTRALRSRNSISCSWTRRRHLIRGSQLKSLRNNCELFEFRCEALVRYNDAPDTIKRCAVTHSSLRRSARLPFSFVPFFLYIISRSRVAETKRERNNNVIPVAQCARCRFPDGKHTGRSVVMVG